MRIGANRLVLSKLLFLEDGENLQSISINREDVYEADMIICGDKVLKNRWGKHGTIGESLEQRVEDTHRILLNIWNEIGKGEKI